MKEILPIVELGLKYLRWPLVVVVLLLIFRKQVAGLLDRIRDFKLWGAGAQIGPPEALSAEKRQVDAVTRTTANSLSITLESELPNPIRRRMDLIRQELARIEFDSDPQKVEFLIKQLAAAQTVARFELVYNLIFGTQIDLLKRLNMGGPMTWQEAEASYQAALRIFPGFYARYPINRYIGFLSGNELLIRDQNQLVISDDGREFLSWMARNGRGEIKPG
jgi:hypothetical protein